MKYIFNINKIFFQFCNITKNKIPGWFPGYIALFFMLKFIIRFINNNNNISYL